MQEPSLSCNQPKPNLSPEEEEELLQNQCNLAKRRNALTPESRNIEPIRQTELQEKMSSLSMTACSETSHEASGSGSQSNQSAG